MNRLFWIIIILLIEGGCATTSYEKCTKGGQAERYGGVDACVQTLEEDRLFRRQQRADYWKSWSDQPIVINKTEPKQAQPVCLTDFVNGQAYQHCYK